MAFAPDRPAILMTIAGETAAPSLARAAQILGVAEDALDPGFGVVLVSPHRQLYAVRVDAEAIPGQGPGASGPFSDPRIEPMR
jgi:hypothetical protein